MILSVRDRRALVLLVAGLAASAVLRYGFPASSPSSQPAAASDSIEMAQRRLIRLRSVAATLPARDAAAKQSALDLADRERGIIDAATAAQGQAALVEIARRVGKQEQLDIRGGEFGAPKIFGDYGLVYATVTFECRVEQLVNFLADLSHIPELVVPSEQRISSSNPKEKTMAVRMVLVGVVQKKLIPERKGLGGA